VKWVRPENIHISLKFLGEVDDAREAELHAALQQAAGGAARGEPRPLTLRVTGFGVFPDFHRPNVLWVGVTPDPGLELLQHRVEQAFAPLGFPPERRPFRPHVTLGRSTRHAKPRDFTGLEEILGGIDFDETVTIDNVELMQSTLHPEGPVYQVRDHGRLF
jgi:RNA 2',3'-cyclic 3'-phosphodiesterase